LHLVEKYSRRKASKKEEEKGTTHESIEIEVRVMADIKESTGLRSILKATECPKPHSKRVILLVE